MTKSRTPGSRRARADVRNPAKIGLPEWHGGVPPVWYRVEITFYCDKNHPSRDLGTYYFETGFPDRIPPTLDDVMVDVLGDGCSLPIERDHPGKALMLCPEPGCPLDRQISQANMYRALMVLWKSASDDGQLEPFVSVSRRRRA